MYKLFLALRYLVSRPIHLIGAVGILVAVWSLIVVYSIFSGYLVEIVGHVRSSVSDLSFLFNDSKDSWSVVRKVIDDTDGVEASAPRVVWYGLIAPEKPIVREPGEIDPSSTAGRMPTNFFQILGIEPKFENRLRDMKRDFDAVEDQALRVADPTDPFANYPHVVVDKKVLPPIVLGLARAQSWNLQRGDIVILASAKSLDTKPRFDEKSDLDRLEVVDQRFVFAGAFKAKFFEFENSSAFTTIGTMRELFPIAGARAADTFSEVAIQLKDPASSDAIEKRLDDNLQKHGIVGRVAKWQERGFAGFLDNVAHQRSLMTYVLSILMAVSAFLVFATLLMMVSEKTRDVGILSALGATRGGILVIFLLSGVTIALVGSGVGAALAILTCVNIDSINSWIESSTGLSLFPRNIYGLDRIPYQLDPTWILLVVAVALVCTLVFSAIPAWIAARMDPVKALRR
ncbi:MAG: ABC transporter permease [Planctomycetes bacterium]|nr:ABC transporter permease [Planctomycetota bacterium]